MCLNARDGSRTQEDLEMDLSENRNLICNLIDMHVYGYVRPYMLILKVGECSAIFSPIRKQTSAELSCSCLI